MPGGVRLGTPAMTARGCKEQEFVQIAEFIKEAVDLTCDLKQPKQKLPDFKSQVLSLAETDPRFVDLRNRVTAFSTDLPYFYHDQLP